MYALIQYKYDNIRAVMPTSLVENFAPKSIEDIPTESVQAYWRASDGEDEGHYESNVLLLGETRESLLTEMAKKKRMVIPKIFDDGNVATPARAATTLSKAQKANRAKAKRKMMAEILQKKKGLPGSESDSSGDELVPKRLLKKAHRENEVLKKKLEVNQDTIQRLTLVLLDKIEASKMLGTSSQKAAALPVSVHGGAMATVGVPKTFHPSGGTASGKHGPRRSHVFCSRSSRRCYNQQGSTKGHPFYHILWHCKWQAWFDDHGRCRKHQFYNSF